MNNSSSSSSSSVEKFESFITLCLIVYAVLCLLVTFNSNMSIIRKSHITTLTQIEALRKKRLKENFSNIYNVVI